MTIQVFWVKLTEKSLGREFYAAVNLSMQWIICILRNDFQKLTDTSDIFQHLLSDLIIK